MLLPILPPCLSVHAVPTTAFPPFYTAHTADFTAPPPLLHVSYHYLPPFPTTALLTWNFYLFYHCDFLGLIFCCTMILTCLSPFFLFVPRHPLPKGKEGFGPILSYTYSLYYYSYYLPISTFFCSFVSNIQATYYTTNLPRMVVACSLPVVLTPYHHLQG